MTTKNSSTERIAVNRTTGIGRHEGMLLVGDMGEDNQHSPPLTSWIFTIIGSIGLVAFLALSFARYHHRLKKKREKEEEYIEYFKTVRPDGQYFEMKISRARCVMTNTHVAALNDACQHPAHREMHDPMPHHAPFQIYADVHSVTYDAAQELSPTGRETQHYHENELPDARDNLSELSDPVEMLYATDEERQYELKSSNEKLNNRKSLGRKPPSGKQSSLNHNSRNVSQGSKTSSTRRKKKSRSFLKQRSLPDNETQANQNISQRINGHSDAYGLRRQSEPVVTSYHPGKGQMYTSDQDSYDVRRPSKVLTNQYYYDCGLPVPSNLHRKIISKSEETVKKSNALYDSMIPSQPQKKEFQELIHRDSEGSVNLNCRQLPQLEAEFYENLGQFHTSHDTDQVKAPDEMFTLTSKFNETNSNRVDFHQHSLDENVMTMGPKRYSENHEEFRCKSAPLFNISLPTRATYPRMETLEIETLECQSVSRIQSPYESNMHEDELV